MLATLVLLTSFSPTTSAPLSSDNPSQSSHGTWKRNPSGSNAGDTRTIQGIVWSCIVTIFACTWVAMHPNLPDPRCSKWSQLKCRTAIMLVAVFVPEFILMWALRQRIGSRNIVNKYNNTVLERDEEQKIVFQNLKAWFRDPPPPYKRQAWTLAHGFYAQMGGFLFYNEETDWPVRVFQFDELLDLIPWGKVEPPIIPEDEIWDRSKGDFFAKLLVVVQTTWFTVQCIVRWILKLPVIELEIVTFSFAVLNLITYSLWWEKPHNIGVGTRIRMKVSKKEDAQRPACLVAQPDTELEVDIADSPGASPDYESDVSDSPGEDDQQMMGFGLENQPWAQELAMQAPLEPTSPQRRLWDKIVSRIFSNTLHFLHRVMLRNNLFRQLQRVVLGPISMFEVTGEPQIAMSVIPGPLAVDTFHAYTAPHGQKRGFVMFVIASGVLFGGLHLIPWRLVFPTPVESTLWRISALYIMLNPVLLSFPLAVVAWFDASSGMPSLGALFVRSIIPPMRIIAITVPPYPLARSLIVLAFTTLRALPPGAYQDFSWSSFIPHI